MNCKPGQLAIIVKTWRDNEEKLLGRVLKCISTFEERGYICWVVEPPIEGHSGICDLALRPINDPGEDAQDETLQWIPVPGQKVTA